jgi:molybdopterin molybdotransferase
LAATRSALAEDLGDADVMLVAGGVSVGRHDHVKAALDACGVDEIFWRVRLKPGKPLWFGRRGETLVFGLPGNPLSTIACFLAFVEPALRRLHGEREAALRTRPARLTTAATASDGRTTFLAATFAEASDGVLEVTPMPQQGSHLTGALAHADGFVVAPHDAGLLPAGARVAAIPLS